MKTKFVRVHFDLPPSAVFPEGLVYRGGLKGGFNGGLKGSFNQTPFGFNPFRTPSERPCLRASHPKFAVFTSFARFQGALPGQVRTVVPVPHARLSFLCVSLEVFATSVLPLRLPHPKIKRVLAHTQVRDPRESAAACFGHAWGPHPLGHQKSFIASLASGNESGGGDPSDSPRKSLGPS